MEIDLLHVVDPTMTGAVEAVQRLRGMFLEVPGTRVSVADAARLCGLERSLCRQALETLTDAGFVKRGPDGTFTIR
jgi:DNA-binding IclR family transcriptional regulator